MEATATASTDIDDRLRQLAASMDCITDEEFQLLSDTTPGTTEAWRKRGKGPSYLRIGNRVLYPRKAVAKYLETLVRERVATSAKDLL
jgi:hypothetical protein